MTQGPGLAAFQRQGRLFAAISVIAILAIVGVMGLTAFVIIQRWSGLADHTLQRLALTWSPAPFYLWALWSLRGMFSAIACVGLRFQNELATGLARIGVSLLLGALTALATTPFVLAMEASHGMAGRFATFDVPALTLAVVGLALVATAQIIRRGIAIEAEAASLRTELGEFV